MTTIVLDYASNTLYADTLSVCSDEAYDSSCIKLINLVNHGVTLGSGGENDRDVIIDVMAISGSSSIKKRDQLTKLYDLTLLEALPEIHRSRCGSSRVGDFLAIGHFNGEVRYYRMIMDRNLVFKVTFSTPEGMGPSHCLGSGSDVFNVLTQRLGLVTETALAAMILYNLSEGTGGHMTSMDAQTGVLNIYSRDALSKLAKLGTDSIHEYFAPIK